LLLQGSSSVGGGSTAPSPSGILDRASSTSGNDFNNIFQLPACFSNESSSDPPLTSTWRGQSIRVYVSLTPLRPTAGGVIFPIATAEAAFLSTSRTSL
jgi:hypothetical protein